eukprot:TRINITY_DN9126_c0_g1_i3.p4 TRINITY_DN9126_c0_g1~~TRINITY_DN9126_c0_g1_i3.p4  ORF type:complete len:155 (-),score=5.74 TRINITY_DN9126_c0_g1_i3:494-958(-)
MTMKIRQEVGYKNVYPKIVGFYYENQRFEYHGTYTEDCKTKRTTYGLQFNSQGQVFGSCQDDDGLAHVKGFFIVKNDNNLCKWVECPLEVTFDPESLNYNEDSVKNALQHAKFFTVCTFEAVWGRRRGGIIPLRLEGTYEANTGRKGIININLK